MVRKEANEAWRSTQDQNSSGNNNANEYWTSRKLIMRISHEVLIAAWPTKSCRGSYVSALQRMFVFTKQNVWECLFSQNYLQRMCFFILIKRIIKEWLAYYHKLSFSFLQHVCPLHRVQLHFTQLGYNIQRRHKPVYLACILGTGNRWTEHEFTFWWGIIGMGESILGVAVGTGAGRLDLGPEENSKQTSIVQKH